ncbi:MAG: ATP-binding protein [Candidatus Promineifilaceae bacterium]
MKRASKSGEQASTGSKTSFWGHLVKPSTLLFWREGRKTAGYSLFDWLHGYVYGRWPYLYIGTAIGEHPLRRIVDPLAGIIGRLFVDPDTQQTGRSSADTYHGKVLPLEEAKCLVTVKEEITVNDLEQVIPYAQARSIILRHPERIVALECPCRTARADPCRPLDVCLIVGEPFASFVRDHHPERSRWIGQAEAAGILEAEHERGHVHHAFFKDAMLGRFYAICNCCACCCGAMQARRNGTPMLASSGYVAQIDETLCIGCGDCVTFCQFDALHLVEGQAEVEWQRCMGCGVCTSKCLEGASQLVRDPAKGEPLEMRALLAMA